MNTDFLWTNLNDELKTLNKSFLNKLINNFFSNDHVFHPFPESIIFLIYLTLLTIGFLSNFSIVLIFIFKNIIHKSLNPLLMNLALSDSIYCLFFEPFNLHNILRKNWPFSSILCKIVPTFQGILIFSSSGTISMIALLRAAIITQFCSIKYIKLLGHEYLLVLLIWIFALVLSSPIFIFQRVWTFGISELFSITLCEEHWPDHTKAYYTVIVLIIQWLLPLGTMIIAHFKVDHFLRQNNRSRIRLMNEHQLKCNPESASQIFNKRDVKEKLKRNANVTRILLRNTIIYGFTWLPLNLINLYLDFYPNTTLTTETINFLFAFCEIIAILSPTLNAYLYYWSNRNIIKELKSLNLLFIKAKNIHRSNKFAINV